MHDWKIADEIAGPENVGLLFLDPARDRAHRTLPRNPLSHILATPQMTIYQPTDLSAVIIYLLTYVLKMLPDVEHWHVFECLLWPTVYT